MIESAPKPGPHLHPAAPTVVLDRPSFRDLAKQHARAASELAFAADEAQSLGLPWESLVDLAQAHADAALACSAVAPVARQRLTPCASKAAGK